MILTPLFTPPLDTAVGGERPTVQLIDVEKTGDIYTFGFEKLKRWIELCEARGVKYFEFSHLFTQWGAMHAPKIMATENGEKKRIFGWETDAVGKEYKQFLSQFLPMLVQFIKANRLDKHVYFHVSDEQALEHEEKYKQASNIIYEYITEYPIIDALSDFKFYKEGIIKNPIPSTNHIELFLDNKVEDLWTYYCCGQYKEVANRFFAFPSARNRVIGFQLYKFNIIGFLQWGYNFWYSQNSREYINPYIVTDAGQSLPSGDAFAVYPGEDGPIISLRLEVFHEGLQDMQALQLLESYIGQKEVIAFLEKELNDPITFSEYPCGDEWLLNKREQINLKIKEIAIQ